MPETEWDVMLVHAPGGLEDSDLANVKSTSGNTTGKDLDVIVPYWLQDEISYSRSVPLLGTWAARLPASPDVIIELHREPVKKNGNVMLVMPPVTDSATVAAAAELNAVLFADSCYKYIQKHYPDLYSGHALAPCPVPLDFQGPQGNVVGVPTFWIRWPGGGIATDIIKCIDDGIAKAHNAGYDAIFFVVAPAYSDDDVKFALDLYEHLKQNYGDPVPPADLAKAAINTDRLVHDANSPFEWHAYRLHDAFYSYAGNPDKDQYRHAFAAALRAEATLDLLMFVDDVPNARQYSWTYGAELPLRAMFFDEQSLAMLLRDTAAVGKTDPDSYHDLVRDFETAVRTCVCPFPA